MIFISGGRWTIVGPARQAYEDFVWCMWASHARSQVVLRGCHPRIPFDTPTPTGG